MDHRFYSIADYESIGKSRMHRFAYDYFNSGADDETSLRAQRDEFDKIKLK